MSAKRHFILSLAIMAALFVAVILYCEWCLVFPPGGQSYRIVMASFGTVGVLDLCYLGIVLIVMDEDRT